jgi:L1 cell adhesion molecule like protein
VISKTGSYVCRTPCFTAYNSFIKKKEQLYNLAANAIDKILTYAENEIVRSTCSEPITVTPSRKRAHEGNDLNCSPTVSIRIGYKSGHKSYRQLNKRHKKYAKAVARCANPSKSIVLQALKDPVAYPYLVKGIGKMIHYEIKQLCSDKADSVQRSKEKKNIADFPWDAIVTEAGQYCPTLTNLLQAATTTKASNKNRKYVFCTIVCILSKFRRSSMSLFQKLISVLLYSGHVGTMVYDRFQKLMISMGKSSTSAIIDLLGFDFDHDVLDWKEKLTPLPVSCSTQV